MFKLDFKKAEEPEIKLPTSTGSLKRKRVREFQKNIYFCFTDDARPFDNVIHSKLWKILKEMEIPDYLTCLLRNLYAGQKETEQRTGLKLGKVYIKAVYCYHAYLTYLQSTSCEVPGWMKHKLESRFPGEIPTISDMQMIPLYERSSKNIF